jgi:hypothetical protein
MTKPVENSGETAMNPGIAPIMVASQPAWSLDVSVAAVPAVSGSLVAEAVSWGFWAPRTASGPTSQPSLTNRVLAHFILISTGFVSAAYFVIACLAGLETGTYISAVVAVLALGSAIGIEHLENERRRHMAEYRAMIWRHREQNLW